MKRSEFLTELADALARDDEVRVSGIGTFSVIRQAARVVRHPQTGEAVPITGGAIIRFEPSSSLRKRIANSVREQDNDTRGGAR